MRRLRTRPDSEHEMRFNGIALSTPTAIYLAVSGQFAVGELAVYIGYTGFCLLIFAHILRRPQACHTRRGVAMIGDFTVVLSEMLIRGEGMAFLFPLFIWIILGNGFRFGIRYLAAATAGSLIAFGVVIAVTPFWRSQPSLSAGLLGGLCLVALAAAPLIRGLSQAERRAETASREKTVLLANVGHELRTPLTAILGSGSMLRDTKLNPAQREMTGNVVSAGQRLLALADDISAASGGLELRFPPAAPPPGPGSAANRAGRS
ncbi:histidine kinase dimerization/phospho-acceptor domain-containing protein [Inquilinus sp.]|uniref:sensor histidine kinase n=1 Tax=Inquilinus sp. TaxID=1932117 RepID=UPI0031DBCF25